MNLPSVEIVRSRHDPARFWVAVQTSGAPDNFCGCYWQLYDDRGKLVSYGESRGWNGNGAGSALSAMKLAKTAARRRDKVVP